MTIVWLGIAVNIVAAALNVIVYVRVQRRLKRIRALERRLDAGPITAAVTEYARGS
jgi:HAMP domain-containing protein